LNIRFDSLKLIAIELTALIFSFPPIKCVDSPMLIAGGVPSVTMTCEQIYDEDRVTIREVQPNFSHTSTLFLLRSQQSIIFQFLSTFNIQKICFPIGLLRRQRRRTISGAFASIA